MRLRDMRVRPAISALLFMLAGVLAAADGFAGVRLMPRSVALNEGRVCVAREGAEVNILVDPMLGCLSSSCTERVKSEVTAKVRGNEIAVESEFIVRPLPGRRICTSDCMGGRGESVTLGSLPDGEYRLTLGGKEIGSVATSDLSETWTCASSMKTGEEPRFELPRRPEAEGGGRSGMPEPILRPRIGAGRRISENSGQVCIAPGPGRDQLAIDITPDFGCASACAVTVAEDFSARVVGDEIRLASRFVLDPPKPGTICTMNCVSGGKASAIVDVDNGTYRVTLGGHEIGRLSRKQITDNPTCFSR